MSGLLAFLQVLPRLIEIMSRLGNIMIQNEVDNWLKDLEGQVDRLESAKTVQEKIDCARNLIRITRNLR